MNKKALIDLILKNAEKITAQKGAIEEYDLLAFPGGLQKNIELLKQHDPNAIELAITYLQANPYCFRSGYVKQTLARLLKKAPLSKDQIKELQNILLARVHDTEQREFSEYCRLARILVDDAFRAQLEQLAHASDKDIARRAQRMQQSFNGH